MSPLSALTKFFSGSRSAKPSRRKASSRRLGVESLEKRQVMAGNVVVFHFNDALQIIGGDSSNQIFVIETQPGVVQVSPLDNTTINGRSGMFHLFNNPSDNLTINLAGGNDVLWLGKSSGPTSSVRNVNVQMGAGSDYVQVRNTVAHGYDFSSFNLGEEHQNDADTISIDRVNFRAMGIGTGAGADRVYSTNSTITKAIIQTGGGHDVVDLRNTAFADLAVSLGEGDDRYVSWNSRPSRSRWVHAGNGWDGYTLGGETGNYSGTSTFESFNFRQKWLP